MRSTIAPLATFALLAASLQGGLPIAAASGVSVRVESTPGGPQISVDGRLVPPRMFFGSERPGIIRAGTEWSRQSFELTPEEDVPGNGTLHFRFGQAPGEVWISDLVLTDAEGGDVLPRGTFATPEAFASVWNVYPPGDANTVGAVEVADGALHATLRNPPGGAWPDFHLHTRLVLELRSRRTYRCSFRVRAAPGRGVSPAVYRVAGGVWHPVGGPPGPFLEQVRCARDAGVRFVSFSAPSPWRTPSSPPDWAPLDRLCRSIVEVHPTALLLPRVGCDAPAWWLEGHAGARMVYEDGRPGTHASVSDRTYRADAAENLEILCRHLAEAFPDHLAGVHPCGQNTGEWFYEATWEPRLSGYDPATLATFRAWLRARGDPGAEAASVPLPQDRHAAPCGLLRNPARERRLVDFALFQQEEMADMVTLLAAAARRGLGPRKLVVFFYGYHYEFGSVANGAPTSGHYALERVLSSPDIDVLCSPISYGDRGWTGTAPSMTSAESVRLAGKLWLNEDDTRTYLSGSTDYGGLADLAQTRSVMRRNTAQAAIRGFGTWWMDLPAEGWFSDPRIWDEMRLLRPVDEAMLRRGRPFEPEIAAIVDEGSLCHLAGGAHVAAGPLIYEGRQALGRVGAPYGQYLLRDAIEGRVPAKLPVFLAAWALGPEARRALAAARREDQVRVWVWAPGWIGPGGSDPSAMEALCGFRCRPIAPPSAIATPTPAGERLGLRSPWAVDASIRPLFAVDASPEETLAVWPDGSAAVAIRGAERGKDAFVATPRLTPELLRVLARIAKAHLYTEVDANVWAAQGILSVHALADGPLAIATGGDGAVTDALTGEEVGRGPVLSLPMRAGETRVLKVAGAEPGARGAALVPGETVSLAAGAATLERLDALPVVDSEYSRRFRYDSWDNPKLKELRERYGLAEVVAPGRDELERQVLLLDWTHRQFRKFGRPSKESRGALEILEAIGEGHSFFCTQYAEVLVSAAASLGWVCRPLALRRHQGVAKVGGSTEHSVTEIWSNQHRKWVMLDPTSDMYLEKDGVPLHAVEIREEWFRREGAGLVFVVGEERRRYRKPDLPIVVGRFEGFGDLAVHPDELDKYGFIGYVPNTDLMDRGLDYGNMFIVQDALCDGTRWHVRTVPANPSVDPYFPIGQATPSLRAEDGDLRVEFGTLTPNLDRFEVRLDGGEWRPSEAAFRWEVHPGSNRLEARTRNRFGVEGPVSTVAIEVRKAP